ncbi:CaiB/BaiF CoA transferase family protein [Sphaerisporangium rubeum]|uniref:Benzylsuccinate CoA-transferase BbsF subunit n=1 Tax=Sphaerisporangium rubeum TaxID=321317 RepID=A0A7X0IDW6_9ACTN|nr:CoA transferase [Sphaerisporangium rubeum]MBB6473341.1 benzylsuccinate CoA-transferase BbsF subunit [Sphaerisporangium rubeum]
MSAYKQEPESSEKSARRSEQPQRPEGTPTPHRPPPPHESRGPDGAIGERERLRVISFGTAIAGTVSSSVLAELGADVVKVEGRDRPDNVRRLGLAGESPGREPSGASTSTMFAAFNRSVRGIVLNMKRDGAVEVLERLAGVADVVIENFGPGVMDRWGVGYERLAAVNPRLVMLSISGYGRTGPRSGYYAYGSNISSFTGLTHLWGAAHGTHYDHVAQIHGVAAVLAALAQRDRTGLGSHIDLAQTETAAAVMGPLLLEYLVNGDDPAPAGNAVPGAALSGVFPCRGEDAWVAVELTGEADAATLGAFLGVSAGDRLEQALRAWTARHTPHQAMMLLQRAGIAAGVVQNGEDVARDPQHRARGFVVETGHPDLPPAEQPGPPLRLSVTPARVRRPAPRLGEHTTEVLREWLDLPEAEISDLRERGVV